MNSTFPALNPRIVIAFIGTWVIALLAANLVPVLIGALVEDLGMSLTAAGTLATVMSLGTAGAMFATNRFVAKGDRPKLARLGLGIMAVGFGGAGLSLQTIPVQAGIILGGIGCGIVIAASTAASSATRNPDNTTGTVMIVNRAGAAALLAVVPLLGNDLRAILFVLAGLGIAGILMAGGLPNLPVELPAKDSREPLGAMAILLAFIFGLWSLTEEMVYTMTEIVAVENVGMSAGELSSWLSVSIIGGLAGAVLAPIVLRVIGRSWSLVGIVVISTICKFLLVTTDIYWLYASALVTWGAMYGAVLTLVFGLAARMAVSGRVVVFVTSVYMIGIALGPMAGSWLVAYVTPLTFGLAVAIPSVLAGLILLWISRRSGVPEHGETTVDQNPAEVVTAG